MNHSPSIRSHEHNNHNCINARKTRQQHHGKGGEVGAVNMDQRDVDVQEVGSVHEYDGGERLKNNYISQRKGDVCTCAIAAMRIRSWKERNFSEICSAWVISR